MRGRRYRRTFTRAEDAATIWRNLTLADGLEHNVYHVSAGVAYSLEEVLQALKRAAPDFWFRYAQAGQEADVEITSQGDRPALDMGRAGDEFCFEPAYTLQQGIDSYLAWARENLEIFRP